VEQKDYATVEVKAREIMGNMDRVVDYFQKGVQSEKSRAKPEIWERWDEFSKLPTKVKDVAGALAKAAAARDDAGVQAQFNSKLLAPKTHFARGPALSVIRTSAVLPLRKRPARVSSLSGLGDKGE